MKRSFRIVFTAAVASLVFAGCQLDSDGGGDSGAGGAIGGAGGAGGQGGEGEGGAGGEGGATPYDPCDGLACGDACDPCAPGEDCLAVEIAMECNADGDCVVMGEAQCEEGLCAGVECPGGEGFCDGDIAHGAYPSECNPRTGQCDDAPGPHPRNCTDEGLVCQDGDCVPGQCTPETCTSTEATCNGTLRMPGTYRECDEESGQCVESPPEPMIDCAAEGAICRAGECVPDGYDPCEDRVCGARCSRCDPNDEDCIAPAVETVCNARGQCTDDLEPVCDGPEPTRLVLDACEDFEPHADPYAIDAVAVEGDQLFLNVSYSGGCAAHEFVICYGGFAESVPVQVRLLIGHNANGDTCERAVNEQLVVDVRPVLNAYQQLYPGGPENFDVILPHWDEILSLP